MKKYPTLYKRTELGQVQQWTIFSEDDKFWTEEGIQGGKITRSEPTICEGKNIGKKNQTLPAEQAEKEAASKWKKKTENNYWIDINDIDQFQFFEPTLAHKWNDYKDEVTFPLLASVKIDGCRCVATKEGLFSRNGKIFSCCPHIYQLLKPYLNDYVFDGEFFNNSLKTNFNRIISLVKKSKPNQRDIEESEAVIQYHCFDLYIKNNPRATFEERNKILLQIISEINNDKIVHVKQTYVYNFNEVEEQLRIAIEDDQEGLMLRVPNSIYEHKRTKNLLKYKEFIDEEFEIVDIEEGIGSRANMLGRFILKNKYADNTFEANSRGNLELYREYFNNKEKYIGKMATVRYQNVTPAPESKPRFGVVITVRDYE